MNTDGYKLIINHLSFGEAVLNQSNPKAEEEYKQIAFLFLSKKGKNMFAEDLLKNYREGMTLERLFDQEGNRFVQGANHKKDGKMQHTWLDLSAMEEIKREDNFFDYFFACKLRHISLLEIDSFLDFHLDYSFNDGKKDFFRFLNIVLRKYQNKMLSEDIVETAKEWIKMNETETELSSAEARTKNKTKRERDDKKTQLNQEQTALLIYCLRKTSIILKDEDLNNKETGQAFSTLTGYSQESLRQSMTLTEISTASKKNVEKVKRALKDVLKLLEDKIEPED